MIGRLLAVCLAVACAAVLAFLAALALTPNPTAPERPRTWPTTEHTDLPLQPPPAGAPGAV